MQKIKSGKWSKATMAERKECRKLADDTKAMLSDLRKTMASKNATDIAEIPEVVGSVGKKMGLWQRMLSGDEDALLELSSRVDLEELVDD